MISLWLSLHKRLAQTKIRFVHDITYKAYIKQRKFMFKGWKRKPEAYHFMYNFSRDIFMHKETRKKIRRKKNLETYVDLDFYSYLMVCTSCY